MLRLARNKRAPTALKLRLLLRDAPARAIRPRLLQHDALPPLRGVRRPHGRSREPERVRVARAHEREPVRDELRRERVVARRHGRLERRGPVEARARAAEHHPVLRRVVYVRVAPPLRARPLVVAVRERPRPASYSVQRRKTRARIDAQAPSGGEREDRARAADVRLARGGEEALRLVGEVGGRVGLEELLEVGLGQAREVRFECGGDVVTAGKCLVGRRAIMFRFALACASRGIRRGRKTTSLSRRGIHLPDYDGYVCEVTAQDGDRRRRGEKLSIDDRTERCVWPIAKTNNQIQSIGRCSPPVGILTSCTWQYPVHGKGRSRRPCGGKRSSPPRNLNHSPLARRSR